MTNIFYLCTRLTYCTQNLSTKGIWFPAVWTILRTIEVSETTIEETVGNFPLFNKL